MTKKNILICFLIVASLSACKKNDEIIRYHKFPNQTWDRFTILKFDIPVLETGKTYDIYFFAHHTKEYEFDNLKFNMIMETPSGENRIKEYLFMIKNKTGGFLGNCANDSCSASIALKKDLLIDKKGMLRIQVEALVPRLEIKGLLGVGIRMVPSGQ
jgi:gliding motility-associated lipoprotein GldH